MAAAAIFGFALVFKFGSRHWRPVPERGWRPPVLAALWLAGFMLVALTGTSDAGHMRADLDVFDFRLSRDEIGRIEWLRLS